MRIDGVRLAERLLVARVIESAEIPLIGLLQRSKPEWIAAKLPTPSTSGFETRTNPASGGRNCLQSLSGEQASAGR